MKNQVNTPTADTNIELQDVFSADADGNPDVMIHFDAEAEAGATARSARGGFGGVISVRIFLQVQGLGSFTAWKLNTANGHNSGWVKPAYMPLQAQAAPGHQFSHWLFNGNFGGTNPRHGVHVRAGLRITAVFTPSGARMAAPDSREFPYEFPYKVKGPKGETSRQAPPRSTSVVVTNDSSSQMSVDVFVDGQQKANIGPGGAIPLLNVTGGSEVTVKGSDQAGKSMVASGYMTFS